jgi:OOP family OmpA-OmpF porin
MTTTLRVIIALVIWLLYSLVAYHGCIKPSCCGDDSGVVIEAPAFDLSQLGPIISDWSAPGVRTNEGYEAWRQNLIAKFKENEEAFLEITGLYYEGEPKPEGFANMGFARADAIKQLLIPDIPADQIHTRARAILSEPSGIREHPFTSLGEVNWTEAEKKKDDSIKDVLNEQGEIDRVVFLFALNATIQDSNPEIMAKLETMAKSIIENKQTVSVVGHADNTGSTDHNYDLGMNRANRIKALLERLGVPSGQIRIDSKGETQPTDTNDTEEGRHNNRRAEVRILK